MLFVRFLRFFVQRRQAQPGRGCARCSKAQCHCSLILTCRAVGPSASFSTRAAEESLRKLAYASCRSFCITTCQRCAQLAAMPSGSGKRGFKCSECGLAGCRPSKMRERGAGLQKKQEKCWFQSTIGARAFVSCADTRGESTHLHDPKFCFFWLLRRRRANSSSQASITKSRHQRLHYSNLNSSGRAAAIF